MKYEDKDAYTQIIWLSLQPSKKGLRFALQFDDIIELLSAVVFDFQCPMRPTMKLNTGVEALYGILPCRQIGTFSINITRVKYTYC